MRTLDKHKLINMAQLLEENVVSIMNRFLKRSFVSRVFLSFQRGTGDIQNLKPSMNID